MHELSIAQSIVDAVETRATECKATHVKSVRIRIGEAIGVVADSLTFCFEMITDSEPLLEGAKLGIETVPHRARCRHCDREFPVIQFIAQCPTCREWSEEIISGTELQILDMEIDVGTDLSRPPGRSTPHTRT
jgi:hydrogenase nickel incorporation protein HypA/HybF